MIGRRPRSALSRRLAQLADESRVSPNLGVTRRLHLLSSSRILIVQLCVACSAAWLIASALLDHPQPFFAPIAAVIALAGGVGQRRRAVLELVIGVAIGIAVGELILSVIGRGAWQLFLVVGLAAAVAVFSGLGRMALLQAVNSAVLISVVIPTVGGSGTAAVNRFIDALVGGLVGLAVTALLPANPVRQVEQEVSEVLSRLAAVLQLLATGLRFRDPGPAWTALHEARAMEPQIQALTEVLSSASEVSRVSPIRWNQRDHLGLYVSTWRYVDHAVRDARVLARRVETMLRRSVAPPVGLDKALEDLAHAVRLFASDLSEQDRFDEAVQLLVETARAATIGLDPQAPLSAVAAVAQVRSLAADLLYATGLGSRDVDELFKTSTDAELDEESP
ncbi:MAG: FUSC family protein [Nocardioidaceae bacterium]|nr:FUSC family protein [Nocardioidaceae bacterium]